MLKNFGKLTPEIELSHNEKPLKTLEARRTYQKNDGLDDKTLEMIMNPSKKI